jgi:threonine dehydrogenase-like Zn-dependent dehydrogenase
MASWVKAGQRVLVVGAGPIGMGAILFARLRGATVTALDSRADRLAFCAQRLGIANCVTVAEGDTEQLAALSSNEFFDIVFDASDLRIICTGRSRRRSPSPKSTSPRSARKCVTR